jgi:hypothetical protein
MTAALGLPIPLRCAAGRVASSSAHSSLFPESISAPSTPSCIAPWPAGTLVGTTVSCHCAKSKEHRMSIRSSTVSVQYRYSVSTVQYQYSVSTCTPHTLVHATHTLAHHTHCCTPNTLLHTKHTLAHHRHSCTPQTLLHTTYTVAHHTHSCTQQTLRTLHARYLCAQSGACVCTQRKHQRPASGTVEAVHGPYFRHT